MDDTQKSSDGLLEVLGVMNKPYYIVEIMCTNPLKTSEDIDGVIEKIDELEADTVCSVQYASKCKHPFNSSVFACESSH